jgi:mRNA interferase RelE/StbE
VTREIVFTAPFDRQFRRLPLRIREATHKKLSLFLNDPNHPSLRIKRMSGTERIWEMSITMNYRLTFELDEQWVLLRRIGTHDALRRP